MIREFLSLVAQGDKDSPLLTERQRRFVNPKGNSQMAARLKALKSFVLLGCDDVRAKKLVLNGQQIVENCYYRMMTGEEAPLMFKFSLTADGKVLYYHDLPHDY